jgi:hypothetical protein
VASRHPTGKIIGMVVWRNLRTIEKNQREDAGKAGARLEKARKYLVF